MDKDNGSAAPPQWQVFCQLTTRQLVQVSLGFSDELRRRADAETDTQKQHLLYLANVRLTEARAYLRNVQSLEGGFALSPVPDTQHGAELPGAPHVCVPAGTASTTTGGAGVSHAKGCRAGLCEQCRYVLTGTSTSLNRTAEKCFSRTCSNVVNYYSCTPGYCVECSHNCECTCGAEELWRRTPDAMQRVDPAPLLTEPSSSEFERRAQRGPKAAEGAREAGRAEQGPVDLSAHLALLKGGAA